jgi:protein-S-isoprenylcysteine O-methyltransferase Ste14
MSVVGLLVLLVINAREVTAKLFISEGIIRYVSMTLAAFGVIIIQLTFKQYSLQSFLGFKKDEQEFKTDGILKRVRHSLYSGTILITIGFFLFYPTVSTLISVACIFVYLPIGMHLEERKLIKKYGERYLAYKKEVPALFPKIK